MRKGVYGVVVKKNSIQREVKLIIQSEDTLLQYF